MVSVQVRQSSDRRERSFILNPQRRTPPITSPVGRHHNPFTTWSRVRVLLAAKVADTVGCLPGGPEERSDG